LPNARIVAAKLRDQRLKMRQIGGAKNRREYNDHQQRQNRHKSATSDTAANY
jgi:hypothetical protein